VLGALAVACVSVGPDSEEPTDESDDAIVELPLRELTAKVGDDSVPPLSLTASDGSGLKLVSVKARAVVQEPLAFTELHLVFDNPNDRTIQGRFQIDLPPDAAISRFAMKIRDAWQEGEVVERQKARMTYESFLHQRRDPALLERQAGNRFSARVFPILANERKELIVSYSQELTDAAEPYRLLLAGLPELDELDVEIQRRGGVARIRDEHVVPGDLELAGALKGHAIGIRSDGLALARVRAAGELPPDPMKDVTLLFDTSASRALGFGGRVERLGELVAALGDVKLRVVAFDQLTATIYEGPAQDFGEDELERLIERRAMGGSDLAGAFARLQKDGVSSRVVLLSDGIATVGDKELSDLESAVRALGDHGVERLDVIVDGGQQDRDVLAALTSGGLARDGILGDARRPAAEVVARLNRTTLSNVEVDVPGSTWSWPKTVDGIQAGDEVLVYAELPDASAMTVTMSTPSGKRTDTNVPLSPVEGPLLARAHVGARIDAMTVKHGRLEDEEKKALLREQIVELSTSNRVLSDFTALLVLETEQDYEQFGIDRRALADILTVGDEGLSATGSARQAGVLGELSVDSGHFLASPYGEAFAVGSDEEDVWGGLTGTEIGEAHGVGGLGLVGTGRGGGGVGEETVGLGNMGLIGRGGGGATASGGAVPTAGGGASSRGPRVLLRAATVHGGLEEDVVRHTVRSNLADVADCYELALHDDPRLRGRLTMRFAIDTTGRVATAHENPKTFSSAQVVKCVAEQIKGWTFPTGKTITKVSYPFDFQPGDRTGTGRRRAAKPPEDPDPEVSLVSPYEGELHKVMDDLEHEREAEAFSRALRWYDDAPFDIAAIVALGETYEAKGKQRLAARAYGSLIDLFPKRADLRRYAGSRLERLGRLARPLATDTYREAVTDRPDHAAGHRLLAYALLREGEPAKAFDAIVEGLGSSYAADRLPGVGYILREDAALIAAVWLASAPRHAEKIRHKAEKHGVTIADSPSTRFVLTWETDTNDVDLHIWDADENHAFYSDPVLPTGGDLVADVTQGFGPECFNVEGQLQAYPYRLAVHYYSRGPMGYGLGKLQIVQHDGNGGLRFDDRPFIIMKDDAMVDLGTLDGPLR